MAYTGMWLSNALYSQGQRAIHQADPAHADTSTAPNAYQAQSWAAPPADPVADDSEYWDIDTYVVSTSGLVLDQTPEDHTVGYAGEVYSDSTEQAMATTAAHDQDYGASRNQNYAYPPMQFSSETYASQRFEVPLNTTVDPVALQRGLNGLAENNPDGFRNGWDFIPYVDRKLYMPTRYHDAHVAEVNTAKAIQDSPALRDAAHYNSPFPLLARAMTRSPQPMIRRDPPPIDSPVLNDGADSVYSAADSWVVG